MMRMLLLALAVAIAPAITLAQHAGHAALTRAPDGPGAIVLRESGQAAFSAIEEAVAALEADPKTDWSRVDIERLRRHLIDMDNALVGATVKRTPVAGGARFAVTGSPTVAASVRRLAAAHSKTMGRTGEWTYVVREIPDGVEMDVTGTGSGDAERIRGLGFAGILARGSHHQAHHMAIASGTMTH